MIADTRAAKPSLDDACNEVVGACDAVINAFPEGPTICMLASRLSDEVATFQASYGDGDLEGGWKIRSELTVIYKDSLRPLIHWLGAAWRWSECTLLRPSAISHQEAAIQWLRAAWKMFERVDYCGAAPIRVRQFPSRRVRPASSSRAERRRTRLLKNVKVWTHESGRWE